MSLKDRIARVQSTSSVAGESIDEGLRNYMLKVYNFMASGSKSFREPGAMSTLDGLIAS